MALTRITKGVIKPNENYDTHNINSTGIVTAIGLDVNGNGDISGNLNVGGVLTYEDVTSIDSVGIITAQKDIHVGAGVSVVGVGTFGSLDISGDIDVDGHTNLDNVSVAGVTTFASNIEVADSIKHNGDPNTQIDFGNDSFTFKTNNVTRVNIQNGLNYFQGSNNFQADSTYPKSSSYVARFRDTTGDDTVARFHNTNVKNAVIEWSDYGNSTTAGNLVFKGFTSGVEGGRFDGSGNFKLNQDLDVDGHTNLDNVSIAGVTTFSGNIGGTATFQDIDVDGHTNLDNVSVAGVTTFSDAINLISGKKINFGNINGTNGHIYYDGSTTRFQTDNGMLLGAPVVALKSANLGEVMLEAVHNGAVKLWYDSSTYSTAKLETTATGVTIDGTAVAGGLDISGDIDVDGHTNLDNISVAGVSTFSGVVKIPTVAGTNTNASLNILFQTAAGVIDGGSALTYNPAQDVLSVNGNHISRQVFRGDGALGTLTCDNHSSTTFVTVSNKIDIGTVDNVTGAFTVKQGSNEYITIDTTNSSELIKFGTAGSERLRITSDGYIGINESNPYAGLTVGKLGDYPTNDGNTYYVPVGKWSTAWNSTNAIVDNTDYWVGYTGGYLKNGCSVNIALAPNRGNTGNQSGMYISGEATGIVSADFTIGKIIGGSATGRGTSGNVRATKSELFRIKNDGRVMIATSTPSSNSAAYMLTVADPTNSLGNCGITIRAGTGGGSNTNQGSLFYSNATSGAGEYAGYLQYNHNDNWFRIGVNSDEKFRISSNGQLDVRANNTGNPVGITIKNINTNNYSHARLRLESQNAARYADIFADVPNDALRLAYNSSNSIYFKSDGRLGINANPSVANEYLHIKPVGNNVLDIRYELNSSTDIRHNFHDDTGTKRGVFAYTRYANSTDYPNFHHSFYMQTDPSSNGSLSTVMRIKQTGEFILPKQPCFSVAMSSNYTTSTDHMANFNTVRFDQGNNFNTGSNGIFTAPVTGKYYMHAAIQTQAGGASQVHIMGVSFWVNGSVQVSKGSGDQYLGRDTTHYITVHCIRILNLAQGDTVQVRIQLHGSVAIEGSGGSDRCNWQGYLMA